MSFREWPASLHGEKHPPQSCRLRTFHSSLGRAYAIVGHVISIQHVQISWISLHILILIIKIVFSPKKYLPLLPHLGYEEAVSLLNYAERFSFIKWPSAISNGTSAFTQTDTVPNSKEFTQVGQETWVNSSSPNPSTGRRCLATSHLRNQTPLLHHPPPPALENYTRVNQSSISLQELYLRHWVFPESYFDGNLSIPHWRFHCRCLGNCFDLAWAAGKRINKESKSLAWFRQVPLSTALL